MQNVSGAGSICVTGNLSSISNSDLLSSMQTLVGRERDVVTAAIEHLIEIDHRKLYLEQACSSLYKFCMIRFGYSEDQALKYVRLARLGQRLPQVLTELRNGNIHVTGLFLLSQRLTKDNASRLLTDARGKSRRELEELLAHWFPRADIATRIVPLSIDHPTPTRTPASDLKFEHPHPAPILTCPEPGTARARLEPLAASRYLVQFAASAELRAKIECARELLSHVLPDGDLPALLERALDALIYFETKRRRGGRSKPDNTALQTNAGRSAHLGKQTSTTPPRGSRHVPRRVVRAVWKRDRGQCTFTAPDGRRCNERRFLTLEHRQPYALGGAADTDNICLLCRAHNAFTAERAFGADHIAIKRKNREGRSRPAAPADPKLLPTISTPSAHLAPSSARQERESNLAPTRHHPRSIVEAQVLAALLELGFRRQASARVINDLQEAHEACSPPALLRAALQRLVPCQIEVPPSPWTA